MKPFADLTSRGQVLRLRPVAESILRAFDLEGARFSKVRHWQNTTFRVDVPALSRPWKLDDPFVPGRFLLRISRPHERTTAQVAGEVAWLDALSAEGRLTVPKPLHTPVGDSCVEVSNAEHDGLDGGHAATRAGVMLHWMPGRMAKRKGRTLKHMRMVGNSMALLHDHSCRWREGLSFDRPNWNCDAIMGHNSAIGIEPDVWDELPADEHELHAECEERLRAAVKALGHAPEVHGIIHADLHFANVLFTGGEARPIDFDDCGQGHYLYDMASTLMGFDAEPGQSEWREAFVEGYRQNRPLDDDQLTFLDTFIAARESTLILWCRSSARTREAFRKALPAWRERALPEIRRRLDA
ncbi:aminoglycoside phosphotransferase [Haloferula helveola]|uniref:Aminoglycoside phosphotransferase n=1 Tax=Haloferula helveola TaxID=490095 RepID=A0ABN6H1H3_9BACT|nr:aminoglycoside phosphotransferase [Haloferula helveola]